MKTFLDWLRWLFVPTFGGAGRDKIQSEVHLDQQPVMKEIVVAPPMKEFGLTEPRQTLFMVGNFTLASGKKSRWKIECDALTEDDWDGLALIAAERLPPFSMVFGVPYGGHPFASALHRYAKECDGMYKTVLIAEDVVTTGGSINRFADELREKYPEHNFVGVCLFARGQPPEWVKPLFQLCERPMGLSAAGWMPNLDGSTRPEHYEAKSFGIAAPGEISGVVFDGKKVIGGSHAEAQVQHG